MTISFALKLAVVIVTGIWASRLALPDVFPRGAAPRIWLDGQGRSVKVLDGLGHLRLITRDLEGRIIQVDELKGRFTQRTAEGPAQAAVAWTHRFRYGEDGVLIEEIDCRGTVTSFSNRTPRRVDEFTGSARLGHRHVSELESVIRKVRYDEGGRVIRE